MNQLTTQPKFSAFLTTINSSKDMVQRFFSGMPEKQREKFISNILSTVSANPSLIGCDNATILSAALLGNSLNLSPSPTLGQFYIMPFEDRRNNRKVATFVLGYKGMIQLAMRSGVYKKLNVVPIKEGELQRYNPMTEEIFIDIIEDDEIREAKKTTGYYVFFEFLNGFQKMMYWSKEKMEAHALKYSKGYARKKGYTFWEKDFDAMACKTMLRQLLSKWGTMSIEMEMAYEKDMMSDDGSEAVYIDNDQNFKANNKDINNVVFGEQTEKAPEPEATETVKWED